MKKAEGGILVLLLFALLIEPVHSAQPFAPIALRCEALENPLAVECASPGLSWQLPGRRPNRRQTAYHVLVARHQTDLARGIGDLWDSGRVESDQSIHVAYRGTPLASGEQAWWTVRIWDEQLRPSPWSAPARWQTGLLRREDWRARWISSTNAVSLAVGSHNGFHTHLVATHETNQWVEINLGHPRRVDGVRLWPARPFDWTPDTPGFLFPLRYRIEGFTAEDADQATVLIDRTQEDQPAPGTNAVTLAFSPTEVRRVRLVVTRLTRRRADQPDHAFALAEMELLSHGTNVARRARVNSPHALESSGWAKALLTDGVLLPRPAHRGPLQPATRLRKEFVVAGALRQATLHVSAQGLYEVRLNGRRVGSQVLAPEWTDYTKRIQYQTFDATPWMRAGANALGVTLAEGWFAGRLGLTSIVPGGRLVHHYGTKPRLLLQLELAYVDGRRERVVSDESWRASPDGPIRSADLLDGEVIDGRREQAGWDRAGFPRRAQDRWQPVETAPAPAAALVAQRNEPIRVTQYLRPVRITEPVPGVYVFDLGQNMVGWCRVRLRGRPGQTLVLRHAETLKPDGTLYTDNLRGVPQEDRFTLSGRGEEVFEPQFTYHGFRYVEARGLQRRPPPDFLTGCVVHSAVRATGEFACSDPGLNHLWRAIDWTLRGNLHSVPTDCPQRDERLGWMGDAQVFAQTACFARGMETFFDKWLVDIRDAQAADGRFPDFAPHPFAPDERFSGAPAWSDAGVLVPWRAYINYGDRRLLEHHFESARRWVDFVRSENPDLVWRQQRGNDYSDWLNGDTLKLNGWPTEGGAVPREVFATAFFAESTRVVARMAAVLGRAEDAAAYDLWAQRIRAAFNQAFVKEDGTIEGDTQAGYALALHFDLLPEAVRERALAHLVAALNRYEGRPSTGIQTTIRMLMELARAGREDLVYGILSRRDVPSWGYMLEQGATTIWERWDGFVQGRGFQDAGMNSFNHYAFGAVGEWLWRVVAGLNPDERQPGWKHFTVEPRPGGALTWAQAAFASPHGRISSRWWIKAGRLSVQVEIPANTTATIRLPRGRNGPPPEQVELGSGTHRFTVPWP